MNRIWLVADDYGIAKPVNGAIRDLIARNRINATSVMVGAPGFDVHEAKLLLDAAKHTNNDAIATLRGPMTTWSRDTRVELKRELARLGYHQTPMHNAWTDAWDNEARAAMEGGVSGAAVDSTIRELWEIAYWAGYNAAPADGEYD